MSDLLTKIFFSDKLSRKGDDRMKIAVMGYSGSGKSTFAKRVSKSLGIPALHLDSVYWDRGWTERDGEEARRLVREFLDNNSSWIIDGNYSKLYRERRLEEADRIILLLLGRFTCLWRVLKRWFTNRGSTREDMAEGCPEKIDLEFILWVLWKGRSAHKQNGLLKLRELYSDKVIVIRTQKELDSLYKKYPISY